MYTDGFKDGATYDEIRGWVKEKYDSSYRTIHQRQAEGIATVKAKGFKFGRPPKRLPEELP